MCRSRESNVGTHKTKHLKTLTPISCLIRLGKGEVLQGRAWTRTLTHSRSPGAVEVLYTVGTLIQLSDWYNNPVHRATTPIPCSGVGFPKGCSCSIKNRLNYMCSQQTEEEKDWGGWGQGVRRGSQHKVNRPRLL